MRRFEVDGLPGHQQGAGLPALLLHGGPGLSDYMGPLADELDGLFETFRYTQRGTPPSTAGAPYSIEAHVADAIAVLDHFEIEQAWAIGHSWGGHLALHVAVAHPDRVAGLICVNALGAYADGLDEFAQNLSSRLPAEDVARADTLQGTERMALIWPGYFADPANAPEMPEWEIGSECNALTFASIHEHFERGTLADGLPRVRLPALAIHGEADPFPVRVGAAIAELIPGGVSVEIPGTGHFPWLEQPGEVRRIVSEFLG